MSEPWLTSLITDTPQAGFDLAVTLSRRGVKTTQPDMEVLQKLRPVYANDADSLTAASASSYVSFCPYLAYIWQISRADTRHFAYIYMALVLVGKAISGVKYTL